MIAHKIIDALNNRFPLDVRDKQGFGNDVAITMSETLSVAEKFVFANIPFTAYNEHSIEYPRLSTIERQMFFDGLLPFPSNPVYFEFDAYNHYEKRIQRTGVTIIHLHDSFYLFFVATLYSGTIVIDMPTFECDFSRRLINDDDTLHIKIVGPRLGVIAEPPSQSIYDRCGAITMLMLYLNLMINSKTSGIDNVGAPEKLNKARAKRGHAPLPAHRLVNIVPKAYHNSAKPEVPGQTGRHMRLHWRRSHIRHHEHLTTQSQFIEQCACCERRNIYVQVIPRFLVGKRELGEITHTYVVR